MKLVAADGREKLEIETESKVVSSENYLIEAEGRKQLNRNNEKREVR